MLRVKDAQKSLKFYQEVLGMSLVRTHESEKAGFNLYFLAYPGTKGLPAQGQSTADREGLLELTWNYGTEKDEAFSYHDGNRADSEGRQGFGHICKFILFSMAGRLSANRSGRRVGGQPRRCVPETRGYEGELEEEADGRAHEKRRVCARS